MKPDERFRNKPKIFWANVRTIGQQVGYTMKGEGQVKVPTISEIKTAYSILGLDLSNIIDKKTKLLALEMSY